MTLKHTNIFVYGDWRGGVTDNDLGRRKRHKKTSYITFQALAIQGLIVITRTFVKQLVLYRYPRRYQDRILDCIAY